MSILEDFLKDTNAARTQDEVYDVFSKAVRKLGFDAEGYAFLNTHRLSPEEDPHFIRIDRMPKEIADMYNDNKMEDHNYIHKAAFITGEVQSWYNERLINNKLYKDFESELYASGVTSGAVIPIFGQGIEKALITIGKYHGKTDKNSEEIQILRVMGYQLHERVKSLSKLQTETITFSSREKEVLQWLMVGKSVSVIGDILGISDHTVNTYLRRCYTKLGVSNQVAAVVKSLSLGLISP